jgi:hypothetical protein
MGGEDQIKTLIRQAFSLQNAADRAVLDVDALLAQTMQNVRLLVEQLPEGSLLRMQTWKSLEPLVIQQMEPYTRGLYLAIQQENKVAAPDMAAYAEREAMQAGAKIQQGLGAPTASSVINSVNAARVAGTRVEDLFSAKAGISPWTKSMFKVVDQKVRGGIIQGLTTQQIADEVVYETISRGVPGVSLQGETSVRRIRAQAMAMSRTVTQDVSRQVDEAVWDANAEAMEGMVYQFTTALDSKTCENCAIYDGNRADSINELPPTPLHPNCRCKVLPIDPEDPFWDDQRRNSQRLYAEEPKYKGTPVSKLKGAKWQEARGKGFYKTKVKVNGEMYWRRVMPFSGDYADRLNLKNSNRLTREEFFGSKARTDFFEAELKRRPKDDPADILVDMLRRPKGAPKFVRTWKKDLTPK